MFILQSDLSGPWHLNSTDKDAWAFDFAANAVLYATDSRPWPARLALGGLAAGHRRRSGDQPD